MGSMSTDNPSSTDAAADWLNRFAQCVRDRDVEGGRRLFHPDVLGFGSWAAGAEGLDDLVRDQWMPVWHRTRGLAFDHGSRRVIRQIGSDGSVVWIIAVRWKSIGVPEGGEPFERRGRATIVLGRESPDAPPLARHTHFSLDPAGTLDGGPGEGESR